MKPTKKNTVPKGTKQKGKYASKDELREAARKILENVEITTTVQCVGEWIRPEVKARLEEERKKQQE